MKENQEQIVGWKQAAWSDRLNPVMVKELRQCLNSRLMLLCSVGTVLALLYCMGGILNWDGLRRTNAVMQNVHIDAKSLFHVSTAVMALASVFAAGVLGMFRYARERAVADLDVGNFTAMSPWQLALGRTLAALTIVLYFYSLCLPLFVTSFFLHGVSLPDMAWTHAYVLSWSVCLIQLMLWCGSCGKSSQCVGCCVLCGFVLPGAVGALVANVAVGNFTRPWMLETLVFSLMLAGVAFMANVVKLSAVHSNRLFGLKCYLLLCLAVDAVMCGMCMAGHENTASWDRGSGEGGEFALVLGVLAFYVLGAALVLVGYNAPDKVSLRVREKCPDSLVGRMAFYLLSSGFGGGVLLGGAVLVAGTAWFVQQGLLGGGFWQKRYLPFMVAFAMNLAGYAIFYVVLADILHRPAVRMRREKLAMLLALAANVLPVLVWIFILTCGSPFLRNAEQGTMEGIFRWLSTFAVYHGMVDVLEEEVRVIREWSFHLGVWLAAGTTLLLLPAIIKDFLNFKKPSDEEWRQLMTPKDNGQKI